MCVSAPTVTTGRGYHDGDEVGESVRMGCNLSLPVVPAMGSTAGGHLTSQKPLLTDKQYQVVLSTWCKLATDISGTGIKFFIVVFKMYPHLRLHFPFDPHSLESKKLLEDSRFRAHACRFMQALGCVVENIPLLNTTGDVLTPMLLQIGRMHVHMEGFKHDDFNAFEDMMTVLWRRELGEDFTPPAQEAWREVFRFMVGQVKMGYFEELHRNEEQMHRNEGDGGGRF